MPCREERRGLRGTRKKAGRYIIKAARERDAGVVVNDNTRGSTSALDFFFIIQLYHGNFVRVFFFTPLRDRDRERERESERAFLNKVPRAAVWISRSFMHARQFEDANPLPIDDYDDAAVIWRQLPVHQLPRDPATLPRHHTRSRLLKWRERERKKRSLAV